MDQARKSSDGVEWWVAARCVASWMWPKVESSPRAACGVRSTVVGELRAYGVKDAAGEP
jgi:hypothetical protein